MCTESIALCEACGFNRHMHYHRCMAWIWSFREIKWAFRTPLDSVPKPRDCPYLDGEVKREILPGRCPNKKCSGHKLKAEQDEEERANGVDDKRTDAEKIEAQRVQVGVKKMVRRQTFRDPLEVGRPHQRKMPVVVMDARTESSGKSRVMVDGRSRAGVSAEGEVEVKHATGRPIPAASPAIRPPARRQRNFNGPMMMPH